MPKRAREEKTVAPEKPEREQEEHITLPPTCYEWKWVTIIRRPTEIEHPSDYIERRIYYKHIHFSPILVELADILPRVMGPMVVVFLQYDTPVNLLYIMTNP